MTQIILAAKGRITTRHGQQLPNRKNTHRGIDQGHGEGGPADLEILAPADGVVIAAGRLGSYGLRLIIEHADKTSSWLAHHAHQNVTVGRRVYQGQVIATMGNSGTVYVHSHQEYRDSRGAQLNPLDYLARSTAKSTYIQSIISGDNDMGFQIRIQENGGLGRTLFIEPGIVTHVAHDDVVDVNNYVGVLGGRAANQVSRDDARRLVEVRGFEWAHVESLAPGEALLRSGNVVNAGRAIW